MLIIDLIYNLSVLVAITVLSGFISKRYRSQGAVSRVMHGLLFGIAAVVGMMRPVALQEGLFFDGRTIVVSLSALFFGPVSGLLSAAIPFLYRIWIGGQGVYMGITTVATAFFTGWYFHNQYLRKESKQIPAFKIYQMGLVVHVLMLMAILLLPEENQLLTLKVTGLPIMVLYPVITMLAGKIISDQEANIKLLAELSASEKHFRTTFFSIGDAIVTTDERGRILRLNKEAEKLTGQTQESVVGKSISNVMRLLHENSGLEVPNPVEAVLNGMHENGNQAYLLKQADGTAIPISDAVSAIRDEHNNLIGAVFVFRDRRQEIARNLELLQSAESYRNLFNNIVGAAYVQNREGRFIDVNQGAVALYGYPKSFFIGKTPEVLSAPGRNDLEALKKHIEAAFEGEARTFEFWGLKADGSIFPKEVHLFKTTYLNDEAVFALSYDISERKKTEEELRQTRERYQALFNASPVGIVLEDLNGIILDVNETVCKDYGYQRHEMLGAHISLIVEDNRRDLVMNNIHRIKTEQSLVSRVTGVTSTREKKIFELIETLIELPNGQKGILSISKNITDQVRAEQAKLESEARNKAMMAAIPDLFFRFTRDGQILDYMAHDTSIMLAQPPGFIGQPLSAFLPEQLLATTMQLIQKTIDEDRLHTFEYSLNQNNQVMWYEARMVKSGADEVLAIVQNVTDRKQAELEIQRQKQFIETLLDSIPNPMFYMNNKGEFLGVNRAFSELYGLSSGEIRGKTMYEIENEYDATVYRQSDERIFQGLDTFQAIERRITLPNGLVMEAIVSKSPFPDSHGLIGGLIGMITDISKLKQLERELTQAKEQAEESDRLKTSFLNNMNHEIRTPLNAIVGFSDLLFEDYTEEEKKSFVLTINNNAAQLMRIIDDVLSISRLDAEHLPLEMEETNIGALLDDLEKSFGLLCQQKSLQLIRDPLVPPETLLMADKGKIRQVMSGLIENAIKYTIRGSVRFGCSLQDGKARFYVKDTGMGIPADEQAHVFERFYRGSEAQYRAMRGNGLGLSISKGLVEIMGGTIGLISQKGLGSEFFFEIEADLMAAAPVSASQEAWRHADYSRFRLLIVDDEADNAELLQSMLARRFGSTAIALNAKKALDMMQQQAFHLVLMDIKMPDMNGLEATQRIVEQHPDTIVIGQTAYSQPEEIHQMLASGAKACLVKPIDQENLLRTIYKVLTDEGRLIC